MPVMKPTWNMFLPVEPETGTAKAIMGWNNEGRSRNSTGVLEDALNEFLLKNADYQDASDALGLVGQVSDLWRKVVKLKAAVIDGKELNGETVQQLLQDLFGHVLLGLVYEKTYAKKAANWRQGYEDPLGEWIDRNGAMPFSVMLDTFVERVKNMSFSEDEPPAIVLYDPKVQEVFVRDKRKSAPEVSSEGEKHPAPQSVSVDPTDRLAERARRVRTEGEVQRETLQKKYPNMPNLPKAAHVGAATCGHQSDHSDELCIREPHEDRLHRGYKGTWAG